MTDTSNEQSNDPEKSNADTDRAHQTSPYFIHQPAPTSSKHYTHISSDEIRKSLARTGLALQFARGHNKLDNRLRLTKADGSRYFNLHLALGCVAFTASIDVSDKPTAPVNGNPLPTAFNEQKKDAERRLPSFTNLNVMAAESQPVIRPARRMKRQPDPR